MGRGETNKGYVGTKVCLSDQFEVEKKKRDEKVNLFYSSFEKKKRKRKSKWKKKKKKKKKASSICIVGKGLDQN